jgi:uncharacterized protein (DUF608 family)
MKSFLASIGYALLLCGSLSAEVEYNPLRQGVSVGGIGTGKIELLPDGRWGNITTQNNPHQPLNDPNGSFAAIHISRPNRDSITRKLQVDSRRGVQRVHTYGAYPIAEAQFIDNGLPVDIHLTMFSPLFPQSVDESCYPASVFLYTVKNTSQENQTVSLAFSWTNFIGLGGTADHAFQPEGETKHTAYSRGKMKGVQLAFSTQEKNPQQQNALGEYVFGAQEVRGDTLSTSLLWQPQEEADRFWSDFSENGRLTSSPQNQLSVTGSSRPAAAIAVQRTLAAQDETTFVFVLSWYMPHLIASDGSDYGIYYTNHWKSASHVLEEVSKQWPSTLERMRIWQGTFAQASIPEWLLTPMFSGMSLLCDSCIALKDGRISFLTSDENHPGNLGSPEERLAMMPFLMRWYPSIFTNELDMYANAQLADGEVPCAVGNMYSTIGSGDVQGGFGGRPDTAGAFVLMVYTNYLRTGDLDYLKDKYPYMRTAMLWMMARDNDRDEIPEGPSLTPYGGQNTLSLFTSDLWLAVLNIGIELGQWFSDPEFQSRCRNTQILAAKNMKSQLWNGNYYQASFNPSQPLHQDAGKLVAGMLPGEWFALRQGWKPHLEYESILRMMQHQASLIDQEDTSELYRQNPIFLRTFTPPLLAQFGFMNAAEKCILQTNRFESNPRQKHIANAGLWAYYDVITGFSMDMHRQCLIVGPTLPVQQSRSTFPFVEEGFSGTITYSRSKLNGQQRCDIRFDHIDRNKDIEIKQIAFRIPGTMNPDSQVLRVMLNDEYLVGQDFTRSQLRVYGFESAQDIEKGDTLSLLLAPKDSSRIVLDLRKTIPSNLGARCSIENFSTNQTGFSFDLYNLLGERQIVFLEIQSSENKTYSVLLNGEIIPIAFTAMEPLPIVLGTSPIRRDIFEGYRYAQKACNDVALRLAAVPERSTLKKRLWDYQDAIKTLLDKDVEQRGFHIEVVEAGHENKIEKPKTKRDTNLEALLSKAQKVEESLFNELDALAKDPILSSEIIGHFVPVLLQTHVGEWNQASGTIPVTVYLQNPIEVEARMRISMQTPPGWSIATQDEVSLDYRRDSQSEHRIRYLVTAPINPFKTKENLSILLSGTWRDMPFRKETPVIIGHDFIRSWLVIGPFSNQQGDGIDYIYPPETNLKPEEEYDGLDQKVKWFKKEYADGFVDFDATFTPNDFTVAYAYVGIYSPNERTARFALGCNGDAKIFLNYQSIFKKRNINTPKPGGTMFMQKLFQGWNHIFVKVSERTGKWGFYLEVTDIHGQTIPDLQYSLEKY